MTLCQRIGPLLAGGAASAVLAGGVVAIPLPPGGPAVFCRGPGLPLAPAGGGYLTAITVTSGCSAWAVGGRGLDNFQLIEHWNGTRWGIQHSPVRKGQLNGVSALSPTDVWAAGETGGDAVFEHFDGTAWQRVPSPLWTHVSMGAVTAVSAADVWAVGEVSFPGPGHPSRTLIVHWNGTTWQRVKSPDPGRVGNVLWGVAAIAPDDIWAAGCTSSAEGDDTLIAHWDGQRWQQTPSPDPPANWIMHCLYSVSATSAADVWAAGDAGNAAQGVIEHWNGDAWRMVPSPALGAQAFPSVNAVVAASPARAWVAGSFTNRQGGDQTLAERWNGAAWQRITSGNPDGLANDTEFLAAALAPSGAVWAVGSYTRDPSPGAKEYPFAEQLP